VPIWLEPMAAAACLTARICAARNLSRARFSQSSLTAADLHGANLTDTNLSESSLIGADLTGAHTKGTIFCNTIRPDGSVANPTLGGCPGTN
jgi:uncharacterized protein YjbI with pentapeptide repeats